MQNEPRYIHVSDRALLLLEGKDGLDLLQRVSTNDLSRLKAGEHAQTVLTNDKGRIVDLITVFKKSDSAIVLCGHSIGPSSLMKWLDRFIVMEAASLVNLEDEWNQILVFGINDGDISRDKLGKSALVAQNRLSNSNDILIIYPKGQGDSFTRFFQKAGLKPGTTEEYERYRILHEIPAFPNELNEKFNPLEVGLGPLVSFSKGCYVGQEVIARLDTYQKVQKSLIQVELSAQPSRLPVDFVSHDGNVVGILTTSRFERPEGGRIIGLGVIRKESGNGKFRYSIFENDLNGVAEVLAVNKVIAS